MTQNDFSPKSVQAVSQWLTTAVAATVFFCGLVWKSPSLLGVGATILFLALWRIGKGNPSVTHEAEERQSRKLNALSRSDDDRNETHESPNANEDAEAIEPPPQIPAAQSTDALVDELLANGRYALLLRPETKQHLGQLQIMRAVRQLDEAMALVPEGRVLIGLLAEQANSACGQSDIDPKLVRRNLVHVPPVYLDRFCVTNAEFQRFIDDGGYENLEFWHEEALPALLDFVDQTGAPGPRYWSDGQYPSDAQRLPVVGISWYEATAFARWVGKRLPTDAEWTKAAAWPVESAPMKIAQRRYPWGESFDVRRAHLYGSGATGPVPVDEFPGGTSVGGIRQLVGNVWEWTATPLAEVADPGLRVSETVMSIRGGAFDTYFENQATCHFQSGEHALARRRNIGIRLALPMSDLEVKNGIESEITEEYEAQSLEAANEPVAAME